MDKKVAIVGYAYRLPGVAGGDLWASLCAGRDLVSQVAADRLGQAAYLHPAKSQPGTTYTFAAGSIGDVAGFDAAFFGIAPREAEQMDPQQRLLLELSWEAFEHAGIRPSDLRGSRGAVYIGFSGSDYSYRRADDMASIDASTMTGITGSIAANRISYQFDLRGPSMAVDTACSSTLVAFHLACQSIRVGEASLALTGGVSLHLHPFAFIGFAKASMLSPRGLCSVFDAAGDGYVRSEGAGIFVLKDLDEAVADGDRILAVVAGSGVNCDGRTKGLTVPSIEAQAALLRDVYAQAGIEPAQVDYLEAHGTGTAVGDPIETRALGLALGQARPAEAPLLIGSVKSNLGHLETASGVAGLAKALGCLEHRSVPPTIHQRQLNPNIQLEEWNLAVVTDNTPLDAHRQLVIGVNSFGFGGANAHVILQSPEPAAAHAVALPAPAHSVPLVLSARSAAALRASAASYLGWLRRRPGLSGYDLAYSAAFRRDWHEHRAVVDAAGANLLSALKSFAAGAESDLVVSDTALAAASRPVFVYSGNGAQWAGMGRRLLAEDEVFCAAVDAVDALFRRHADFSLVDELCAEEGNDRLALTEVAQPTLFAVQVGITEMLRAWGVMPAAVVGHSVGEVAAAWACGALSLEQAVRVISERSTQQGRTRGIGGMTAVGMGAEAMQEQLQGAGLAGRLVVAGINSPRGVTVAGELEALTALERRLGEREVFQRRLKLDYAFHSPAMDRIAKDLLQALADLRPRAAVVPFYSTVSGGRLAGERLVADYWWRNVRDPVQFDAAVTALIGQGYNLFVEIGPNAILRNYVYDCLREKSVDGRVIATMGRGEDSRRTLRAALGRTLIAGAPIDLDKLFPVPGRFVDLPAYPWQRERYWHPVTVESYGLVDRVKPHPLLGYRLHEHEAEWENQLDTLLYPNLRDHAVGDAVVFPAAGFIEMALAAAGLWHEGEAQEIEGLEIRAPLILDDSHAKTVRLRIDAADGSFSIRSRERLAAEPWLVNVLGRLLGAPARPGAPEPLELPARPPDVDGAGHYRLTAAVGLDYGPAFQTVAGVWHEPQGVLARLAEPAVIGVELQTARLHPGYLDGAFQLLVDILREEIGGVAGYAFVPVQCGRLVLHRPSARVAYARATLVRRGPRSVVAGFALYDRDGQGVAVLEQVRFRAVPMRRHSVAHADYLAFHAVPVPRPSAQPAAPLPATERLLEVCARRMHQPERSAARRAYYGEVEPLLDVLCAAFAEQALRQIATHAELVDPPALVAAGVVREDGAALLSRLVDMLEEDGVLEPTDAGWRWVPDAGLPVPAEIWTSLLGDYPDYAAEFLMVGRVGLHLPEVLTGLTAAEAIVPQGCESVLLQHYNAASPSLAGLNLALADLVRHAMAELPPGRRLRILEWSPCRSALSDSVLPMVDFARCDYVLGAPTQRALDEQEVLAEHFPALQTRLMALDGPSPDATAFDLVLVAGGAIDIADADRLFAALRPQLADQGLVVVVDQYPARWTDLVFGLRRDWWGENGGWARSRTHAPGVWQALAARHGLAQATLLPDVPEVDAGTYLMLLRSTSGIRAAARTPAAAPATWVLLQDPSGYSAALATSLAGELRALGHNVVQAHAATGFAEREAGGYDLDPGAYEQWAALLTAVRATYGGVDALVHLYGLRPDAAPAPAEQLQAAQQARCVAAQALFKGCEAQALAPACWLVTARAGLPLLPAAVRSALPARPGDAEDAPLWGLGRTAINEYPDLAIRLVDCADPDKLERMASGLLGELLDPDAEDEIILTADGRFAPRLDAGPLLAEPEPPAADAGAGLVRLDFLQPGPLKHLLWRAETLRAPRADEVEIEVRAAGLNFRDVMYAMGLLSDEAVEAGFAGPTLGMELSGVVRRVGSAVEEISPGDAVIAFAPASFASRTLTTAGAVVPKPADWSFEAAATIPTAFFTVYYALHHLANLQEGERILVHGAAGGVGIAAIQLAKLKGAEIFATAGSAEKRDFLRLLGADHIMDSRSLAYADQILQLTGGEGVDVVLNSLAGEAINRNLRVLRPFGRFLELGKRDFYENTRIGLRPFRNNISYFGIDADQLMAERPELTRRLFRELMELFAAGALKPLPFRAFPAAEVVDAFRYMQQSRQIGKVVLSFRDGVPAGVAAPRPPQPLRLSPEASYLVTGGLGGFGLKTAQWLASKGARYLVLLGRRGLASPEAEAAVQALTAAGVTVRVHACDVTRRKALEAVFADIAATLPPLRGVVHAAMVVADGLLRNLDEEKFHKVLAPKVLGARHLHDLSAGMPLEFFVLYSSATTLFGNPGQGNYVAANLYLEALAACRRAQGLPAVCLSWGAIEDVGYLARNEELKASLQSRMGGAPLSSDEALQVLEQALRLGRSGLGVMDLDWSALRRFLPAAQAPKFSELARQAADSVADGEGLAEIRRLVEELDAEELAQAFTDLLKREVGEILRIPPERLDEHRSMYDQGMDSLMGMELVAAVEARFGVNLPIMALSEGPTIARLVERIIRQLKAPLEADAGAELADQVRSMAARHGGEVDALALQEVTETLAEPAAPAQRLVDK